MRKQANPNSLAGIDIFAEEILVKEGKSQLSAAKRAAVLVRAEELRRLEALLDREAVKIHLKLLNAAAWQARLGYAWDLLCGKLGEPKFRTQPVEEPAHNENKQQ